jgi:hypothetical protein
MKKDWTSIIAEQKASGESVSHFCKSQVLSKASFYYQKKRRSLPKEVGFIQVETGMSGSSFIEIFYPNGVRIKLSGKILLSELSSLLHV